MPQQQYDNELRGVLFPNDKQGNDQRPDYTGNVTIKGVEYRLAGWKRVSGGGQPYMSLSVTPPESTPSAASSDQDDFGF